MNLRDECSCIDFLDALETANLSLIQLGQQPGEHLQAFLDSLTIDANGQCKYKNTDLTHYDANADYKELQAVIEAVTNRINGIFESDTDPVKPFLQAARVFDIKEWPNDRAHLAAYGNAEIQQLSDHFSDVLDNMGCERNQLQQEWTVVKAHFGNQIRNVPLRPNQNVLDINSLFRDRNRFKHIKRLVQIVLTLLVSSAICERGTCRGSYQNSLLTIMSNMVVSQHHKKFRIVGLQKQNKNLEEVTMNESREVIGQNQKQFTES
ncbi:hypothetical protein KUTeg_008998 [Tegillarca granosa]|uniref:Uncharacterized protein n=1 Tax=Tegillarca granosa TaxID=220873 RepID=A0ABQ9FB07_TEGGR|nr:hypothetical protein KUTeg_008998 [Tegillarca granosa]